MRLTNERELVARLKEGDEKAFVDVYNAYSAVLYSFLVKLNGDREDIRDVIQQTFTKLWEHRATLNESFSLQSYLITIAKNDIQNMVKKRIVARKYQEALPPAEERVSELNTNELYQVLLDILNQLPEKRRAVFSLSRMEGYSNKEIAEKLKVSKSTVENHINQSTKQVKGLLKKLGLSG